VSLFFTLFMVLCRGLWVLRRVPLVLVLGKGSSKFTWVDQSWFVVWFPGYLLLVGGVAVSHLRRREGF
jgi:hypothetical protein